jgi:hypothetical protein
MAWRRRVAQITADDARSDNQHPDRKSLEGRIADAKRYHDWHIGEFGYAPGLMLGQQGARPVLLVPPPMD